MKRPPKGLAELNVALGFLPDDEACSFDHGVLLIRYASEAATHELGLLFPRRTMGARDNPRAQLGMMVHGAASHAAASLTDSAVDAKTSGGRPGDSSLLRLRQVPAACVRSEPQLARDGA
jgi:hypothetical protein